MNPVLARVPDPPDDRDHLLAAHLPETALSTPLPSYYYARPYPTIIDQSNTPDCVGYSGSSYRASEEARDEKHRIIFDGADLYSLAKKVDGSPTQDGTYIRAAAKQLVAIGGLIKQSTVPSEVGQRRKIASYARLISIEDILRSIKETGAAWLGSSWFNSWFKPVNGVLPKPDSVAGGHAYSAVGWKHYNPADPSQTMIRCPQSWGTSWGQKGFFWLPAAYIDFSDFDCWSTLDVKGDI
ncbi:MAG TPA: C1 family peptidase [Candidatus Limnocylindrales bacterium]|nr:C1 family peptidase [Candidatus Limnocylindrales bacterium]